MYEYQVVFQGCVGEEVLVLGTFSERAKAEQFAALLKECDESVCVQVSKE